MADKPALSGLQLPVDATLPGEAVRRGQVLVPALFSGRATATQSISASTFTALLLGGEDIDNSNGHSTSANTSRFTPTIPGWYWVCGGFCCNGTTGSRAVTIFKNNAEVIGCSVWLPVPGTNFDPRIATKPRLIYLNGTTDYVETMAWTSVACSTVVTSAVASSMDISLAMAA